jgi:hypothetical protein
LAVLFGCSYKYAEKMIRAACTKAHPPQKQIRGMYNDNMIRTVYHRNNNVKGKLRMIELPHLRFENFEEQGEMYKVRGVRGKKQTLTQWYKGRTDKGATYLVNVTGHYVVVRGTRIIDNQTKAWEPFHARRKHKRSHVRQVWKIERSAA